jgi:hypothetical protein
VAPKKLDGMEILWQLLEEVDKKNLDLVSQIIFLITRIYSNLSSVIEDQIHVIGEEFTEECLTKLSHIILDHQSSASSAQDEKKNFVKNLGIMMKSFFEDSEKNGTGNLRTH